MPSFDYVQNKLASRRLKDNRPPYPRVKTISASPGEDEKYVYIEEEKTKPIPITETEYNEFKQNGKIKRLLISGSPINRPKINKTTLNKPHNTSSVGLTIEIENLNPLSSQDYISQNTQRTAFGKNRVLPKSDKSNTLGVQIKNKIIVTDKPKTENKKTPSSPLSLKTKTITPDIFDGPTTQNIQQLNLKELSNILDTILKLGQHETMLLNGIIKLGNYGAIKKIPIAYKEADLINLPISKIKNAREGLAEKGLISFEFIQTEKGKKPTCHYVLTVPWC